MSLIKTFHKPKIYISYIVMISLFFVSVILGISVGSASITISETISVLLSLSKWIELDASINSRVAYIILDIRLPRVLLASLVGASLAVAGAAFQGLLRNPLADPYTLGASSGAAVGAVTVLYFGISIPFIGILTLPVFAILSGFITLITVILFARTVQRSLSVETIILTGIIFSSFLGAIISLLISLSGDEIRQLVNWLLGSVGMRGWNYVYLIIPFFFLGFILLLAHWRELNAFVFGEQSAHHLGIHVERKKFVILFAASLLTGSAVAVSGTIGFVGLVIPHFVRIIWGADHKHLIPLSALVGGIFLVVADLIARTIISPAELPIGVITALIGAPVFGLILISKHRGKIPK
ncbi:MULTISPECIES: FecCD family ABC transporter permease [Bacillaceae]|uniref:Iron ABC transporter permease n=1 Tax=Evansella alkalicola TaxID=745819 RepID=A0ABS6K028_9BACI|nr:MULTISPECIES: iron chelate uptake ABC transporter family permease subunit [Bacillaceae]MBU9724000.1 iron ABC transporter permease [Bacillus alkalicola]